MKGSKLRRGFTLIELLVVILIIAILAALIVPKVIGRSDQAKVAAAKADLATLRDALEAFDLDCGRYPTESEGLQALRAAPSDAPGWKSPYLQSDVPVDPWGHAYVYQIPGPNGSDFAVESYGSDGVPGGDGYAADIIVTG